MTPRTTTRRCPKCGQEYPLTIDFWYFRQSGPSRGAVTGYCISCQNAACRAWGQQLTAAKLARRRVQQRDWMRQHEGYDPDRYRGSKYDAVLAHETGT